MGFSLLDLIPKNYSNASYIVAGIIATILVVSKRPRGPNLDAIPTVGSRSWLGSWGNGLKFLTNAADIVQEGYEKYKTAPFKVADVFSWIVILSSREHIEELVTAEKELSLAEGSNDRLNLKHTLGQDLHINPYHVAAIRTMTRNIGEVYSDMTDEIVVSFDELLDLRGNEWKSMPALDLIRKVVCRTSNRIFVGLPLCRNPDWIDLNIQYTLDVGKAGFLLGLFPKFMRSYAVSLFRGVAQGAKRGQKHLGPIIEQRMKELDEFGEEEVEKHHDIISWMIVEARDPQLSPKAVAGRMLATNVTAIHAAANSFTHALYYLAENPQYIKPLREEAERIIEMEGWTRTSVCKMRKIDSFLRECQRLQGMDALIVVRKAVKDYTFRDGTFLPKGTLIGVASRSVHYEEKFYENPKTFQPFRFADLHIEDDESARGLYVSTATDYLPWGHGKHACTGRVFAAHELKSMLAYVVMTYDVKLEDNATRPPTLHFGTSIMPDPKAKVLFRKRAK